jgi:hypothetical protein
LITTPNFAKVKNIFEILIGDNPQPDPEELFATVNYNNEGIHRREYVKEEIYEALEYAGFVPVSTSYINLKDWKSLYDEHKTTYKIAAIPLMYLFPRLRSTMMITAKIY